MKKHQFYYNIKNEKNLPLFIGKKGINIKKFISDFNKQFNEKLIINFGYFVEKNSKKKFCELKKGNGITHLRFRITYSDAKINEIIKYVVEHYSNIENKNLKKTNIFGTWTPKDSVDIGFICGKGRKNLINIASNCKKSEGVEIWYSNKNNCFNIKCHSDEDLTTIKGFLEYNERKYIQINLPKENLKKEKKVYTHKIDNFPTLGKMSDNTVKNESKSFWSNAKEVNLPGEFNLSQALFKQKEEKRLKREFEESKMREELEEYNSDDFSDDESYYSEIECY